MEKLAARRGCIIEPNYSEFSSPLEGTIELDYLSSNNALKVQAERVNDYFGQLGEKHQVGGDH